MGLFPVACHGVTTLSFRAERQEGAESRNLVFKILRLRPPEPALSEVEGADFAQNDNGLNSYFFSVVCIIIQSASQTDSRTVESVRLRERK